MDGFPATDWRGASCTWGIEGCAASVVEVTGASFILATSSLRGAGWRSCASWATTVEWAPGGQQSHAGLGKLAFFREDGGLDVSFWEIVCPLCQGTGPRLRLLWLGASLPQGASRTFRPLLALWARGGAPILVGSASPSRLWCRCGILLYTVPPARSAPRRPGSQDVVEVW